MEVVVAHDIEVIVHCEEAGIGRACRVPERCGNDTALDEDVERFFNCQTDIEFDEAERERKDFVAVAEAQEVADCSLLGVFVSK